jgi:hypothetical protein
LPMSSAARSARANRARQNNRVSTVREVFMME